MSSKKGSKKTKGGDNDNNNVLINMSAGVPPCCMTCGRMIGHLYKEYLRLLAEKNSKNKDNLEDYIYDQTDNMDIIKKLGLDNRYCCFRHIVTHPSNLTNLI